MKQFLDWAGGELTEKVRRELFVIIEVFYVIIMVKVVLLYAFGISEFKQNNNEYPKIT